MSPPGFLEAIFFGLYRKRALTEANALLRNNDVRVYGSV
jgi:hypothetical protein